jgi:hypothetical protein
MVHIYFCFILPVGPLKDIYTNIYTQVCISLYKTVQDHIILSGSDAIVKQKVLQDIKRMS